MSASQDKKPTEVLWIKRLQIVDDEGKVLAVLGTNGEGGTSVFLFDQSAKQRATPDANDAPEQMNGLGLFDTNWKPQVGMGAYTVSENGGGFYLNTSEGKSRGGLGIVLFPPRHAHHRWRSHRPRRLADRIPPQPVTPA